MTLVGFGISSSIILVGDGGGGVEVKYDRIEFRVVATLTFLDFPCLAFASMKRLNYISTYILFFEASSNMSIDLSSNSSSSSDSSSRMSLRFPFPFVGIYFFFVDFDISWANCQRFYFVIA